MPEGWLGVAYEAIDSTNAEGMRRAGAGDRGPLWLTARVQTQGRGRSGRSWASAGESLAATLLFAPRCTLTALPHLSLVAGIAAHDAIVGMLPCGLRAQCRLKWPNDVLIEGAKVAGILVESTIFGLDPVVVIGTGINVGRAPAIGDRAVTSLRNHGSEADVATVEKALAAALAHWIRIWADGADFATVRAAWLSRSGPLGEPLTINSGGQLISGRFAGLDQDGGLLLHDETGATRKFSFGDVALGAPRV